MRAAHYCSRSLFRPSSRRIGTTMPSADFCRPVRIDHSTLSPDFGTDGRSPEVSSTAFRTQPADLQPVPLMDMGFAVIRPLARHRMPLIRFLYIGSYVCSTLLSDPASRRRRCASLSLHLHQVVKGTFTPKLSNMLGTRKNRGPQNRGSALRRWRMTMDAIANRQSTIGNSQSAIPNCQMLRRSYNLFAVEFFDALIDTVLKCQESLP